MSDSSVLDDALKALVHGGHRLEDVVHAFVLDGMSVELANVLAAAACLRFDSRPLTDLLQLQGEDDPLPLLRRYLPAALHATDIGDHAPDPIFDPGRLTANQLLLTDRCCPLRFAALHPRIALLDNVLDADECAALIALGENKRAAARIFDSEDGRGLTDNQARTSTGCFIDHGHDAVVQRIDARISELVGWPIECREVMALSHYQPGQQYFPHHDYFTGSPAALARLFANGGQRIATVIVYLNEVSDGGATVFPIAGIELRPQCGSACYFSYQRPDRSPDPAALHEGAPVVSGEKWIATFWFREQPTRATTSTRRVKI